MAVNAVGVPLGVERQSHCHELTHVVGVVGGEEVAGGDQGLLVFAARDAGFSLLAELLVGGHTLFQSSSEARHAPLVVFGAVLFGEEGVNAFGEVIQHAGGLHHVRHDVALEIFGREPGEARFDLGGQHVNLGLDEFTSGHGWPRFTSGRFRFAEVLYHGGEMVDGRKLSPDSIRFCTQMGMFPMGNDRNKNPYAIEFYISHERAIFRMEGIHVSRSLKRAFRREPFEVRFDTAFREVMSACRRPKDNWITPTLIDLYERIYKEGWAHSCEVFLEGELVGGVYGIAVGGVFCAESMFHRHTNASKIALWKLHEKCRELGFVLFDAQVINPHLESLGALTLSHHEYMGRLNKAMRVMTPWSTLPFTLDLEAQGDPFAVF